MIAMTELRATYGYVLNDLPLFKVRAYNARGWSEYSLPNDEFAYIQTEPTQMGPVERNAATTDTEIVIDWNPLSNSESGYSTILAYNLQWDKGTSGTTWYDLYGVMPSETDTTFYLTSEISPGSSYLFRVRA